MPSIINSDNGVVSGTSGLKTTGGNDGILSIQNNGTTNVTVTAAGDVGVGTSSPAAKLEVNGAIKANGVTLSGYDVIGGGTTNYLSLYANSGGPYIVVRGATGGSQGIEFGTGGAERVRITSAGLFQFNSGYGSVATAYGCRAWVKFNSSGTVSGSGNISSVTKTGTGTWTLNFSTAMPDANYSVVGSSQNQFFFSSDIGSYATGSAGVRVFLDNGVLSDNNVTAAVFR
jgi:hypothetical protein